MVEWTDVQIGIPQGNRQGHLHTAAAEGVTLLANGKCTSHIADQGTDLEGGDG